jgi:imidazolonepropionase
LQARSVDHLEQASRSDVARLAGSESVATLLPGSVFYLGLDRYAPARLLIDEGTAVALATGYNPGTSPTPSMPMIISLACLHMKMSPAEAIAAATINGACALGYSKKCGSLEAGKDADLLVLDCSDYRELPYRFGANPVALTIKRGKVVYSQGQVEWPAN